MTENPTPFVYNEALEDEEIRAAYENAPVSGRPQVAALVDMIPLGMVKQRDEKTGVVKEVPKVAAVFQIADRNKAGYRFTVRRQFSLSLNEKAALRPVYEALVGRQLTQDEARGKTVVKVRDLIDRILTPVLIKLVTSPDQKYTNVESVSTLPEGMTPLDSPGEGYTRMKDRQAA